MIIDIKIILVDNTYRYANNLFLECFFMYRYLCAALLSVAIHFLIFAPLLDQPAMAIPLSQQTQSVSISFTKPAKVEPKKVEPPTPPVVEAKEVVKPTPKPVAAKPVKPTEKKRIVKQKTKPKEIKKETPKPVQKVVKKKPISKEEPKKITEPPKEVVKSTPAPPAPVIKDKIEITKEKVAQQSNELQSKPQLIQKSRFLSTPTPPKYPRMAKRRGIEGTVTYEVWLDEKGKQTKLLLKDSSGAKVLDVAALKAIKNWEFSPHIVNGKRIAHRIYIPISFQLD